MDDKGTNEPTAQRKGWREVATPRVVVRSLLLLALLLLLPVVAAGKWDWWAGWSCGGLAVLGTLVSRALMIRRHPDLAAERAGGLGREDARKWDQVLLLLGLVIPLLVWLVAGLEERFSPGPRMGLALQLAGLGGVLLGYLVSTWAMVVNRFFSSVVRIQKDRGHAVISSGPYRFVRHPGYAGGAVAILATPLLLGSFWALLPAGLTVATTVIRAALEDRTLQQELPGYAEYASRTRFLLLPGIW